MPRPSRIEPVHIKAEDWLKRTDPPLGAQEGHSIGLPVVAIRYATDVVGEGPNRHVHPYDEVFHILQGRAQFTVGEETFEASAGDLIVGPANVPHSYKNLGPGRLDSYDVHLNSEWIQYDLPVEGEQVLAQQFNTEV